MNILSGFTRSFRRIMLAGYFLFFIVISCSREQPVDFVDPFICTQGDHGHWLPAALVPFGLVELCPDTWPGSLTADGDFAHSGYDYSDSLIRGFSHLHRGSSGGTTIHDRAGHISILPFKGKPESGFFSNPVVRTDKSSEKASAGYYTVYMPDNKILAELSATVHTGFHRYTFSGDEAINLFIYEGNRRGAQGFSCRKVDDYCLEGSAGNKFFVIRFNLPVNLIRSWSGNEITNDEFVEKKDDGGIICEFINNKNGELLVKTGVSLTSVEGARKNLVAECDHWNFNKVRKDARNSWNSILSRIRVEGKNNDDKKIFYTALYHTCFLPVIQSDVDASYTGLDQQIHKADGYKYYDGYAFWDSFRTKYPLYSLFCPDVYSDITASLCDTYRQAGGWGSLPGSDHPPHGVIYKAAGKNGYQAFASCRHEHMLMVVADAFFKGLMKNDIRSVYPFMKREVMLQMPEKYDTIGFIPARPDQTGEYSWDNRVLAEVAKAAGYDDDYDYLMKRSEYWRNTWDPQIKYFRARAADGKWLDFPDDPAINREKYTYEGSKWHWRWNVIHDIPALTEMFGGEEEFVRELEYFFENDLYTAGNQIDLHAPFLFNMAGAPWLTQKWVRKILTEPIVQKYGTHDFFPEPVFDRVYKTTPDGYLEEMDDDYGCMAGWYAMSSMGLYQVCPGIPVYQITAPLFDRVFVKLDKSFYKGRSFVIRTIDLNPENIYIQSATLNGEPLKSFEISHEEIADGGELILLMGKEPNKKPGI